MSKSREEIMDRLHTFHPRVGSIEEGLARLPVVPMKHMSSQQTVDHFVEQATLLSCYVYKSASARDAIRRVLDLLGDDKRVMSWAFEHVPLPGLEAAFKANSIRVVSTRDETVRVGITGADAALASTGSLILLTGEGKPRTTSLLPSVHVAIIHQDQILTNLETWVAMLRKQGLDVFQNTANAMIISGPSRTADIAMQLILGMHGPGEMHIIILEPTHP
jgi:L-lactate dehydrogenase complex protein LldG